MRHITIDEILLTIIYLIYKSEEADATVDLAAVVSASHDTLKEGASI